ncbi:MAG: Allophanate hydrolase 2 subunit 2 [uncultured Chthoniobacterales bacterium]|uniref:Allophanate hydrolase 2 subunit 2 n=1 Tax=uncultured Chthoniobacterales bacterium TaxID=1836801 RepID=A0A6J4IXP4_9BACT|nr:MAG: Allophanate hydrolase 2 subunit 2 [uncultured Chthoniobacterales bacterium]
MSIHVLSPGFLTTVQDNGRGGYRNAGVASGGALDSYALKIANWLVGNDASAAGVEVTLGGVRLRFADARVITWCGGKFDVRVGGTPMSPGRPVLTRAGDELTIQRPEIGCRAWLAISGGVDVPSVLGSRSTDLRAKFGGVEGRALQPNDVLQLGPNPQRSRELIVALEPAREASWFAPPEWAAPATRAPVLRVMRGGEWLRFDPASREALLRETFTVTPHADRMGVRLEGPALHHRGDELPSEPVAAGTIQVPPSGEPILLLPDCQTIGGYPKLAHVITVDLPLAAQLRPGDRVRFELVRLAEAHRLLLRRERQLAMFRLALKMRSK